MKKTILSVFAFLCFTTAIFSQDSLQTFRPPQPLSIAALEAKVVDKNIQLIWTVNGNEDAKSFEVERAVDETNFKKIGGRLSVGRTGTETYEFVDALPKKNTAFSYRVKIIAKDGSVVYSDLRSIKITESAFDCKLKQNPVRHLIEIQITALEPATLKAEVYSAYGQKSLTETAKLSTGINNLSFSSQNLSAGIHRLVLETATERKVISFVKE